MLLSTTGATETLYTAASLTRGTTYKFKVLASNLAGDSSATETVSFTAAEAPGAPTSIVRLSYDSQPSIKIGWTAPIDNGGSPTTIDYEVYSDNGLAQGYSLIVGTTAGATSYTATGLTAGTTYFFRLKTTNEVGTSAFSSTQSFLAGSIPSEPRALTIDS